MKLMNTVIAKTLDNLRKNNMAAFYAETKEEAVKLLCELMKKGDTVSVGGSVTLDECNVLDILRNGDYDFLDRYEKGLTPQQKNEIFKKTFFCNTYITSANAVTENGELINVDGNSNRVAAITFGPESVICLVGKNKLVADVAAGFKRVKETAAPMNAKRLGCNTPCAKTGICCKADEPIASGCSSNDRICVNYVVSGRQRIKDRIKVIICNEDLGY